MKKINIGFITEQIRDDGAGIGQYSKHFIEYFLLHYGNAINPTFVDYKKTTFNAKHLLLLRYPFGILRYFFWFALLPFRLKKINLDYIFSLNPVPHPFAFRQKEVLFIHDLTLLTHSKLHPFIRVFMSILFFKLRLHYATLIVANSQDTERQLLARYPWIKPKLILIPYTYSIETIFPKKPKWNLPLNYLLNINTIEPRKNINTILYALKELRDIYNFRYSLIIAGKKGWMYSEIFKTIKKFQLQEQVLFPGFVTNAEKKYLLQHADIFIYPSLYEGYGIPVLEAMFEKCPVITSNNSNLKLLVKDTAITINPKDYILLASSIYKLVKDSTMRKNLKERAFHRAKELTNSKQIKFYYDNLFRKIKHENE